jgi:hypothetical protein
MDPLPEDGSIPATGDSGMGSTKGRGIHPRP